MERELIAALHTAARRYCRERFAEHCDRYARLCGAGGGYDYGSRTYSRTYSNAARDLFPRYQQVEAVQRAIERFVPEDFDSLEQARERLADAVSSAEIPNPATRSDPISARAAEEERAALLEHLEALDDDLLWRVLPLPFRRALGEAEAGALREGLVARYGRWYGGEPDRKVVPPHLTFVRSRLGAYTAALGGLVRPLAERFYELNEDGPGFELDLEAATFTNTEGFWLPREAGWMINASHENTLTIAGPALIDAVYRAQPGWLEHRVLGPVAPRK